MQLVCKLPSSVQLSRSTFTHHSLNNSRLSQPQTIHEGEMAALTLSWTHFNVINWDRRVLLQGQYKDWNIHSRQYQNVTKSTPFPGPCPYASLGALNSVPYKFPTSKACALCLLTLISIFTMRKTVINNYFSFQHCVFCFQI